MPFRGDLGRVRKSWNGLIVTWPLRVTPFILEYIRTARFDIHTES